jgi:hypothetical protein
MMMATPGKTVIHGASSIKFLASLNMFPHDGAGGGAPNPRKLREASAKIA